ncbi:sigma-70 family RNA polymerase sigma factor [Aquimarina sp. MMG016]|uniref:RNA polymerase sigma factor n=1 Tax=Aquimarina sp. MMG016 TaxID=2822690 RepID=UPI001B3A2D50|nr:sigma-70 family RNA polymerase sigma factor [Aquimarina sp. MMG016]MBQ4820729.1 sigma-70 family RNA polymerase sigma factor [Aquimarina sp. MMG016]
MDRDKIIIAGIINGDQRVLKGFYNDNIRYIKAYILKNYGTTQDVEDVFQDAFMILYQKLKSGILEVTISLKSYFLGICKNIWRNQLRKNQKFIINNELINKKEANNPYTTDNESKEREHLYRKYFQKLSVKNKYLLLLSFEGNSAKEIATIMGYSEGYTRKKKFEVKKQLFDMIEKDPLYRELKTI